MKKQNHFPKVTTPSGAEIEVLNEAERRYYQQNLGSYLRQYNFENPADITALETLLTCQLLIYRFQAWATFGVNHEGEPVNVTSLIDDINKLSQRVAQLLETLQISRKARSSEQSTPAEIIDRICRLAEKYEAHKYLKMGDKLWEFYYFVSSVVRTHLRMNEKEKMKFKMTAEDVLRAINSAIDEVDFEEEQFREERKNWIRTIKGEGEV